MVVSPGLDEGREGLLSLLDIRDKDLDWRDGSSAASKFPSLLIPKLSGLVTQPKWTVAVASTFPALLSAVLEKSLQNQYVNVADEGARLSYKFHITVALSKVVRTHSAALQFAESLLSKCGSPLSCLSALVDTSSAALSKKPRRQRLEFTVEDAVALLEAVLILLKVLPAHIAKEWPLKDFLELPKILDSKLTWLSLQCVGVILSLSEKALEDMNRTNGIDAASDLQQSLDFQCKFEAYAEATALLNTASTSNGILLPQTGIVHFPGSLLSIAGTLVNVGRSSTSAKGQRSTDLVQLTSTVSTVREIALSLSSKVPICLIGPIGSGKSSLIKYTASLFGRGSYPSSISIQMSDQIDSRLLLGSYHSTDLPGQFTWRPGALTKAVLHGHWIVLEDVDSAPADVMALLDGLMDTNQLSVPGYGEIGSIHPDFRAFATCRTQVGKRSVKLGKQWKRILVESMSCEDMKILVTELFPYLKPLADRLIGIYDAVATFQSDLGRQGRTVSLRDFLKFCRRIPPSLDLTQTNAAIVIFQEACALFINSFSSPETRQEIAEIIGTQLNLLRAKAEYFCSAYKAHINICSNTSVLTTGRYSVPMLRPMISSKRNDSAIFSLTKKACNLLETLCGSLVSKEPVLLIGETGVGKTSCVQFLASVLQQKLIVVNLNRQSDSGDLLGGYKPVELKHIFRPIREEFEALFTATYDRDANSKFLGHVMTCYANRRWKDLVGLMIHVHKSAITKISTGKVDKTDVTLQRWTTLGHQLARIELQISSGEESPFAFSFIEGTLITAIKNGYWILLDEINLATPEMLQCLSGILEEEADVHLWEKGDEVPIVRNSNFHLFAAMNPSTDVGKKDLPLGLRNRFTEVYVEELTEASELQVLVSDYLKEMALSSIQIERIVEFYLTIKSMSQSVLVDGMSKKPHFSLRTLCRALQISALNLYGSATRSLYESFCLSFLTQLDYASHPVVQALVAKHIFGKVELKAILNQALPCPASGKHVEVEGYWIPQGNVEPKNPEKYILTPSIRRNLKDLARIISAGRLPVLIQGETSVGKTSLIQYAAAISGNTCYRINNHQHTDLQEYIGSYQADEFGKLVFTEGILVTAMRRGEWIILDELNLAPSEVLEALNRLLDDNRQLFITETGQTVAAHPRFMLFATQNPPGLYGGRKVLSRAFRNRFIELHFDEIPTVELETILHHRCNIPQSYCKKIIGVLRELQMRRKASAALEGKHGFATLRDLFRWAERYRQSGAQSTTFYDWDQHLADEGYLVMAGKVRKPNEAEVIREVLQKHLKRTVDPNNLFSLHDKTSSVTRPLLETLLGSDLKEFRHIVWTFQMRRLGVLIGSSLKFREPILLVGETGGGKTSIVQLLTHLYNQRLFAVNCHMHSEGSDFLGGLRPVRNHLENDSRLFEWVDGPLVEAMEMGGVFLADEISLADDSVLERINSVLEPERTLLLAEKGDETPKLVVAHDKFHFIGTMNPGGDFGKKELSPALRNRLTEIWCEVSSSPEDIAAIVEHNLTSSVRGQKIAEIMISFVGWLKRNELANRCTISIRDYLSWTQFINSALEGNLKISLSAAVTHGACLAFLDGLGSGTTATENVTVSQSVKCQALEYLESLTTPLNSETEIEVSPPDDVFVSNTSTYVGIGPFYLKKHVTVPSTAETVVNGASTVSDFTLEAPTTSQNALRVLRALTLKKPILLEGSPGVGKTALIMALGNMAGIPVVRINLSEQTDISDLFGADLPVEGGKGGQFEWRDGPLLEALKKGAWILLDELNLASQSVLEGLNACLDHRGEVYVPELNRTFKIAESGHLRASGAREDLRAPSESESSRASRGREDLRSSGESEDLRAPSESDDLRAPSESDDLRAPVESESSRASRDREDLRSSGENVPLRAPADFGSRIFGCQNPVRQGGARKGLPKSFLNRFTQVHMDSLSVVDLSWIMQMSYPSLPEAWVSVMAQLGQSVVRAVSELGLFGAKGTPWDFNLRDLMRWGALTEKKALTEKGPFDYNPSLFVDFIYGRRMRTREDQEKILALYAEICEKGGLEGSSDLKSLLRCGQSGYNLTSSEFHCGHGSLQRLAQKSFPVGDSTLQLLALQKQLPALEALTICLEMGWMPILVGPTKSGKTSLVKLLSQLTGRDLKVMTVSPEMDTIELLGGFEQADIYRKIDEACAELGRVVEKVVKSIVGGHKGHNLRLMDSQLLDLWSALHSLPAILSDGELLGQEEEMRRIEGRVALVESGYRKCRAYLASATSQGPLQALRSDLEALKAALKDGIRNGAFQWVDSLLVKAVRDGDWLLIDGANRCSAAVLDRLNSLMESDGRLYLSERGSIDGKIIEMKPHVNFRLILTMDPAFGEISRAMRNRGVEIYLPGPDEPFESPAEGPLHSRSPETNGEDMKGHRAFEGVNDLDLDGLARAQGPGDLTLRRELLTLHEKIYAVLAPVLGIADRPHIYQTLETIQRLGVELQHGTPFPAALSNALNSVYLKGNLHLLDSALRNEIQSLLAYFQPTTISSDAICSRLPASISNFLNSQLYRVWRVTEILETTFQAPCVSQSLESVRNALKDKSLLEQLLLLAPFLRISVADSQALVGVLNSKFPDFEIAAKLAAILESDTTNTPRAEKNELPWDPQWKPHYLAKTKISDSATWDDLEEILKKSLLLHAHLFKSAEVEDWKRRSVGFIAREINQRRFSSDSETTSSLYSSLWKILEKLDEILVKGIQTGKVEKVNFKKVSKNMKISKNSDFGSLWLSGIKSFHWRKRLYDFSHSESEIALLENMDEVAKLLLLVDWTGTEAIGFLENVNAWAGSELKSLIASCLEAVDHVGGNCGSLKEGKALRKAANTKPFPVYRTSTSTIENVLGLCLDGWSLNSTLKAENLASFLMSSKGEAFAAAILNVLSLILKRSKVAEDVAEIEFKSMTLYYEMEEVKRRERSETELDQIQRYVAGLEQYVRINGNFKNSAFAQPLLQIQEFSDSSAMVEYLNWEEIEMFRRIFLESSNHDLLPLSCLLPHFVSKVLLDDAGRKFRAETLESREVFAASLESIAEIVSKKVTSRATRDEQVLEELSEGACKVLQRLMTPDGDQVTEEFEKVRCSDYAAIEERMASAGMVMLTFGLELMERACRLPTVDPAVESKILKGYLVEEINFFETWVGAQRMYELTETGFDLASAPSSSVHPFYAESLNHLKSLREQLEATQKMQAHRPNPPQYDSIRQDLKQFTSSFMGGSREALVKFKKQVTLAVKGQVEGHEVIDTVTSCHIWIESHANFVKKVAKHFWYWDITAGFLAASAQVSVGLTLIGQALNRLKLGPTLEQRSELNQLVTFPLQYRNADDALNQCILSKDSFGPNFTKSIYTASLISFLNEVETEGCASASAISKLHNLSASVAAIWNYQEEEKQKAQDLEDAMYVFKGRERSMGLSEEEQEIADVSSTFPDYVEDLIDLEVQNTLESGSDRKKVPDNQAPAASTTILSADDLALFLKIHQRLVNQIKTYWIAGKEAPSHVVPDFVTPYLIRFQTACLKFEEFYQYLGKEEENQFALGTALAIQNLQNFENSKLRCSDSPIYDFYHDANVPEVHRLSSVLNGLKTRVKELLQHWSEHPALNKILEITARLESFVITSPVMRFLTCMELLLSTAQEWESCAHKGVSISSHLAEITDVIISWRKLELQCWKNLLELEFQRNQSEAQKWWFHLYASTIQIVTSPARSLPPEFLANLHKFMESSPLGQFSTRLNYLYNIHCHLISLQSLNASKSLPASLQPFLWNTYNYYKQFLPAVAAKLKSLRSPIEKKMKDFVKISRWNDANYYALKDSVQKNQRMLTKFVKEWKKAMALPVSSVLVADVSGAESLQGEKKRSKLAKAKSYVTDVKEFSAISVSAEVAERWKVKRLARLGKIFKKVQKVVKPVLEEGADFCRKEIEALEDLTGTIIQDVHELQSVEIAEKSGEKRRKMLHSVHFRKRSALADLFKTLTQLNVSYRRGLVTMARDDAEKFQRSFQLPPVDISAGWMVLGLEGIADSELVSGWEGCELYFQKCLSRMAVMTKSFESPSKELGPRIIERCKGFVADLMVTSSAQKEAIADFSQRLWTLQNLTSHNYATGQDEAQFQTVYQESCRIDYEVRQVQLLVQSLQGAEIAEISKTLDSILLLIEEVKETLKIYVDSVPIPSLRQKRMEGSVDLDHALEIFGQIQNSLELISSDSPLGSTFTKMSASIGDFCSNYQKSAISTGSEKVEPDAEKFGRYVKFILQNVLLTFQKLDKLKAERKEEGVAEDDEKSTNVKEFLSKELEAFGIQKIVNGVLRLVEIRRAGNCPEFESAWSSMAPLLHQYSLIAQFYLTIYVHFHRSTSKLLSVLLGIFATLASKGFCLPSDYEEDAVAEGGEMDAAAGMGLGDGDTSAAAQDVSDRLESEDQLEDTLKEGEAPPSADKDLEDEEEGVEMSEDFEGKQQDKKEGDEKERDESESEGEENDLEKQMGDVEDPGADKLDDQMWGGSSDEEDESLEEKDEEAGKGSNRQSEPELRAKDPSLEEDAAEPESDPKRNDEPKSRPEVNDQDDEEVNDDQVDPYHGNQPPEEEPEDFDLPEDLNLDGAEPKDHDADDAEEENPFDLDAAPTEVPEDDAEKTEDDPEKAEVENEVSEMQSEDEDPDAGKGVDVEKPHFEDDEAQDEAQKEDEAQTDEALNDEAIEAEAMEVDEEEEKTEGETESKQKEEDKAEPSEGKSGQDQTSVANEKASGDRIEEAMDTTQEDKSAKDETASGQAESQDGTGHEGTSVQEDKNTRIQQDKKEDNASRKPGDTDTNRSLANEQKLPAEGARRLKTLERPEQSAENEAQVDEGEDDMQGKNADLYQHVKDAEKSDAATIDNSTREQAEKQKQSESEKKDEAENPALEEESAMNDSETISEELQPHKPEKSLPGLPEKPRSKGDVQLDSERQEAMEVEVEGDKVQTAAIQRPADSTIETRFDLLEEWAKEKEKSAAAEEKRLVSAKAAILTSEQESASLSQWHELDGKTLHLAQELCEQLRLVLEPTQAARLKGNYKTGKRLNMRKVIPYIASGFRKDKIWLRRTQPSKREYQILLALDDSASMADNQSKQMAFSAVAVVARSLSLLEAGQLGVVGFGEDASLLHAFDEPFTDFSGAKLIQRFTFAQRATRIAQLLEFAETLFQQAKDSQSASLSPEVAQLLLIVSDGRGVSHEGSGLVQRAVRRARDHNIFIVFIVVDNPENKDSILDIRLPIFRSDGSLEIAKYMDHFPFPFYLILRDLQSLPSVLSDALRQWFELVTSSER